MFDGGIFFGREPKYGIERDDAVLVSQLRATHTVAVATHWEAVYVDMYSGNDRMRAIAEASPDVVVPFAVVNPTHYDCQTDYIADLKKQGFAGIACFPSYQGWSLARACFRRLVKDVAVAGLPLQIAVANGDELSLAVEAVRELNTPVLIRWIRGGGYAYLADMIAIAVECPHVYFDVGTVVTIGGISYLSKAIGAERLYVATNTPLVYEQCTPLLLATAGCSSVDYAAIAGNTLARLFKKNLPATVPPVLDTLPDMHRRKIEVHWHGQGWDIIEPCTGLEHLQKSIEQFHYEAVIVSSILALNYDLVRGNEETARWTEVDRRVHGYIVIDPTRPDVSMKELEKYHDHPGFVGMKTIQDYYPRSLDHASYRPMIEWAVAHDFPLLCHRSGAAIVAKQFPGLKLLIAHMTKERMAEFFGLPNVWVDISASYAHRGETDVVAMIEAFGEDRVLFAADGPLMSPAWSMGKIVSADLPEQLREKLYYTNAKRLFPRLRFDTI